MATDGSNDIKSEGKYTLLSASMSAPGGRVLNLTGQLASADIYESILASSIIGVFQLYDAVGMFNSFVFEEQEFCLAWSTNDTGKEIHYKFKLLGGNPAAQTVSQGKGAVYTITGISPEAYNSAKMKDFQEKFPAVTKKIEPYALVTLCLEKALETEKPKYYEKTKGLHTFNFTKVTPFEAIEKARQEAISSSHDSSSFVFFENKHGYHFKTIEALIEEGKKRIGDKVFFNVPGGGIDTTGGSLWRNIIAYKIVQLGNQAALAATGGAKITIRFQDIQNLNNIVEKTVSLDDFDFEKLNKGPETLSPKALEENKKQPPNIKQYYFDSKDEENDLIDKKAALACYMSGFLSVINHITIYGDTEITAGDVITVHINDPVGTTDQVEEATSISGNFLVTKVRHCLTFGETPQYYQALEIVKDSMNSQTDPIRAAVVN
jgi:hypothetical protein